MGEPAVSNVTRVQDGDTIIYRTSNGEQCEATISRVHPLPMFNRVDFITTTGMVLTFQPDGTGVDNSAGFQFEQIIRTPSLDAYAQQVHDFYHQVRVRRVSRWALFALVAITFIVFFFYPHAVVTMIAIALIMIIGVTRIAYLRRSNGELEIIGLANTVQALLQANGYQNATIIDTDWHDRISMNATYTVRGSTRLLEVQVNDDMTLTVEPTH